MRAGEGTRYAGYDEIHEVLAFTAATLEQLPDIERDTLYARTKPRQDIRHILYK
jgi:hypothetical protein